MLRWIIDLLISNASKDAPAIDNSHRYEAALELERRLYEAAVEAVEQTFSKEGLVAAFLTSGAIVAFAGSLQAFAQVVPQVGQRATWMVTGLLFVALILLIISVFKVGLVLRGWSVKDLSDAIEFLDTDPQPVTRDEVALKLISEYRQARLNHEILVVGRLKNLFGAMRWVGGATVVAFLAILVAFLSVSLHRRPLLRPATELPHGTYNMDTMAEKPTSQKPPPTVLPKPGSGTTMIKGGGGNGSHK